MIDTRTKVYSMVYGDRLPLTEIADLMGLTVEQVEAMAKSEGSRLARSGFPPHLNAAPDRGHTVTGCEQRTCEEHGPYQSDKWTINNPPERMPEALRSFWSQCPACNRIGEAEVARRTAEIRNRKANVDAIRKETLRASGIPERFMDCDVWHWQRGMDKQREVWNVVKSYCMRIEDVIQHGRCLVLFGASGTGKTHLACGIVRHVVEKGGTAKYLTIQDAIGLIRSTYSKEAEQTEDEMLAAICKVDVLVLDEIGRQSDSAHERESMFRMLNRRYADLRPTILVSNLERVALFKFLGQALCDRLMESGGRFLNFDWASQRNKKAKDESGEGDKP